MIATLIASTHLQQGDALFVPTSKDVAVRRTYQVRKIATLRQAARTSLRNVAPSSGAVNYDVQTIYDYYDRRPWEVTWRLNSLGLPLLMWYIALLFDEFLGLSKNEQVQRRRGVELRDHLVRSGSVALIKTGQALSLRPDILRNHIWAEELGKLSDAVGSFSDRTALSILCTELADIIPRIEERQAKLGLPQRQKRTINKQQNGIILDLFDFYNDKRAVASASIGQVYKATIRRGPLLEAAIGKVEADYWGGKVVAIKVQRPDAARSAALDMYLIRRAAEWLSMWRGGDLTGIADQFGRQLFSELDYVHEASNGERFKALYGSWENVRVPASCISLSRKQALVTEWVDGEKGPWLNTEAGKEMIRIGLRCSVDQLLNTGFFHADPHKGNLLKTPDNKLAFIDFGMMADVSEEDRYGLIGLAIGLQQKDLSLVTENLLKLGFLKDTTQLDVLVPKLRKALKNSTGGSGKASEINFARLQAELDNITQEKVLQMKTPAFFTIILRSLTILEGFALAVDKNFRLVRGAYPYVIAQLLSSQENERVPRSLTKLLTRLLTVDGKGEQIDWGALKEFLRLAKKAARSDSYREADVAISSSRETIEIFFKFLTSKAGLFLKEPLVHELAEAIDGMASLGEANLLRLTRGIIRPLPGGNGPVNEKRMEEVRAVLSTVQAALSESYGDIGGRDASGAARIEAGLELLKGIVELSQDAKRREEAAPVLAEISSVIQLVAVEVLEIRGTRAMRNVLNLIPSAMS